MFFHRLFAWQSAPIMKNGLPWNPQHIIAAVGIASIIFPAVCESVEVLQKRQNPGYQSPSSQSTAPLYHHRAHHSCMYSAEGSDGELQANGAIKPWFQGGFYGYTAERSRHGMGQGVVLDQTMRRAA